MTSPDGGESWDQSNELVVYQQESSRHKGDPKDYAEAWKHMSQWTFGHPAGVTLSERVLSVAYYAGRDERCLSTLERKYGNVCRWGLRGEIKAGGGRRCLAIFDDDQRRDRPQPPSALRVATGRADLFVTPPPLWQGMAFVVVSRSRPVALATNVAVFTFQCTKRSMGAHPDLIDRHQKRTKSIVAAEA